MAVPSATWSLGRGAEARVWILAQLPLPCPWQGLSLEVVRTRYASLSHRPRSWSDPTLGTRPLTSSFQGMPPCSPHPILRETLAVVARGFGVLSVALALHRALTPPLCPARVGHFPGSQTCRCQLARGEDRCNNPGPSPAEGNLCQSPAHLFVCFLLVLTRACFSPSGF